MREWLTQVQPVGVTCRRNEYVYQPGSIITMDCHSVTNFGYSLSHIGRRAALVVRAKREEAKMVRLRRGVVGPNQH